MRRYKPTANPSGLLKIKKLYEQGEISEKEMLDLRKAALSRNVYTGKVTKNETRIQNTRVLKFETSR